MKLTWLLIIVVMLTGLLAGCKKAETVSDVTEVPAVEENNNQGVPYPANEEQNVSDSSNTSDGQPYPAVDNPAGSVYVPYPDISDGTEVDWKLAKYFIEWGFVDKIIYQNPPEFVILLKDGRSLIAKETEDGALLVLIDSCGPICQAIELQTK